jgi:thymidylate synthase
MSTSINDISNTNAIVSTSVSTSVSTGIHRPVSFYGEEGYLDALRTILEHGELRQTRNAETISLFHVDMGFNLRDEFPLLTTKRVYWKGIVEELLWFTRADTDAHHLAERGVHIWDGNTTRGYLDSIGLNMYRDGECGPIYGYQWRSFNKPYVPLNERTPSVDGGQWMSDQPTLYRDTRTLQSPTPKTDQLQTIINELRSNPTSRRLFMSGWNPVQMDEMCLPPCHVSYQFYVSKDGGLSCHMTQRSGDFFLGLAFNIGSCALLTYMIAHMTGYKPDKLFITVGDAHIYKDHIDAVREQLTRTPYTMPRLKWKIAEPREYIEDYRADDFELENYRCHPTIRAKMVA